MGIAKTKKKYSEEYVTNTEHYHNYLNIVQTVHFTKVFQVKIPNFVTSVSTY
jgi:hypothetical protein